MDRRQFVKTGVLLTAAAAYPGNAAAKKDVRKFKHLEKDYEKREKKDGDADRERRLVKSDGEIIQSETEDTKSEIPELDDWDTVIYDEVRFGGGEPTKYICYQQEDKGNPEFRFDGKIYTTEYKVVKGELKDAKEKRQKPEDSAPAESQGPETIHSHRARSGRVSSGEQYTISNEHSGSFTPAMSDHTVIQSAPKSKKDGHDWWEGVARATMDHTSTEATLGMLVFGAADVKLGWELYDNVYIDHDGEVEVIGNGHVEGVCSSAAGGGRVTGGIFIREGRSGSMYSDMDNEWGIDRGLGLVDGWAVDRTWNAELTEDVTPGRYDVGIRFFAKAAAATTAAAQVSFENSGAPGGFDFDYVNVIPQ
ncbi:hypothetical protein NDI56_06950 [Haloarcula sp. S1CR25-12]|uniref:Uncharacterized protein n=1 Tax=Haloarcula saliterrae TaxID=2950534 RepID=A0ABU2FB35_9EURY|nr:hypothetical protein [Haloarcula sp. S1CR25-12]MDS0259128.1 hypothetical protein [Haloarcula sp. S1CR25-12]